MADLRAILDAVLPLAFAGISLTLFLTHNDGPALAFMGAALGSAPGGFRRGNPPPGQQLVEVQRGRR